MPQVVIHLGLSDNLVAQINSMADIQLGTSKRARTPATADLLDAGGAGKPQEVCCACAANGWSVAEPCSAYNSKRVPLDVTISVLSTAGCSSSGVCQSGAAQPSCSVTPLQQTASAVSTER
jgi:hypothetical protein